MLMIAALFAAACGGKDEPPASAPATQAEPAPEVERRAAPSIDRLVARLQAAPGMDVTGVVVLTADDGMLHLGAAIDNLTGTAHAIHVHEVGDCSAADFSSAGGHFNPGSAAHAGPDMPADQRHAGDFGNFDVNEWGQGKFTISVPSDRSLAEFDGRAVIVHEGVDDLESQPSGAAGARIACGVLGRDET
jgi:Cu-Zn family superoxide dismutase